MIKRESAVLLRFSKLQDLSWWPSGTLEGYRRNQVVAGPLCYCKLPAIRLSASSGPELRCSVNRCPLSISERTWAENCPAYIESNPELSAVYPELVARRSPPPPYTTVPPSRAFAPASVPSPPDSTFVFGEPRSPPRASHSERTSHFFEAGARSHQSTPSHSPPPYTPKSSPPSPRPTASRSAATRALLHHLRTRPREQTRLPTASEQGALLIDLGESLQTLVCPNRSHSDLVSVAFRASVLPFGGVHRVRERLIRAICSAKVTE